MSIRSKDIISELRNGNKSVFEELYRTNYTPLLYFCIKYVENMDEAEEIVQGVFVKLWEKHSEIQITTSLKSYLHRAVQNSSLNHLNRRKILDKYVLSRDPDINTTFHDPHKNLENAEIHHIIMTAILELPEKRREIFELSRFEGMKYKSIAKHLSISVKTVENQMTQALKYLRIVLKDHMPALVLACLLLKNLF
ncbi:MAG: RNA polymerase sigma-70 factor [Bacteroidales bacterium]|jgi:RNA polymerase sigma-70 factor, ECF subfamily|nr:RNA polymerase sigma-70 factor [Lentimicrobiaceae bacterium]MDG1136282.1 RNA polymerase sigma-70 factor [Bacteroidales bacterium]MDG1901835.1 RNA polymerase sigma-70 factor [Bacteroidales bacterium]MDG2081158.1 RNA polymerase sigma-70 factor [Bacteroidales bacterium]|tara:strand:- start:7403 stop:7987 length:585 start_codon:yes stop_codon:yes gene_type:complete